jgi:hypothetical protein
MSSFFQNIDPPIPSPPGECVPPRLCWGGGGHTRRVERGVGVNILEDARHSSVLYLHVYRILFAVPYIPISVWQNVFSSDYSIFLFAEREKLVLLTRNCRTHLLKYLNQVAGIAFAYPPNLPRLKFTGQHFQAFEKKCGSLCRCVKNTENTEWQRPLSGVHSIMRVNSAQAG